MDDLTREDAGDGDVNPEGVHEDAAGESLDEESAAVMDDGTAPEDSENQDPEKKELREKYLRLYAEFDNYRKRVARDREELLARATEKVVADLFTVVDHLELALQHRDEESAEALIQGVEITLRELTGALEKNGITAIEATGCRFDPTVHHAMTQMETIDVEENIVLEEFRKGYRLGDRVIRPALVAVAKRPAGVGGDEAEEAAGEPEAGQADGTT